MQRYYLATLLESDRVYYSGSIFTKLANLENTNHWDNSFTMQPSIAVEHGHFGGACIVYEESAPLININ